MDLPQNIKHKSNYVSLLNKLPYDICKNHPNIRIWVLPECKLNYHDDHDTQVRIGIHNIQIGNLASEIIIVVFIKVNIWV